MEEIEKKKGELQALIESCKTQYQEYAAAMEIAPDDEKAKNTSSLFKFFSNFISNIIKIKSDIEKENAKNRKNVIGKPLKL